MSDTIHVAVAVIKNQKDEICISLRHEASHQGGLWEFPGGKVEADETVEQALIREIDEELGLEIKRSRPLITIDHTYKDAGKHTSVRLHVYLVTEYEGIAKGQEDQLIRWVAIPALSEYEFPAANLPIINAVSLSDRYLITGKFIDHDDFIGKLKAALKKGISLVQLRLKQGSVDDPELRQALVERTSSLCKSAGASLLLNITDDYLAELDLASVYYSGTHADSRKLKTLSDRPSGRLFSASCHDADELAQAVKLRADFVVLSPVKKTTSHPDMEAMGWDNFSMLIEDVTIPVYALGGVTEKDITTAWSHGAQGIAAISALWEAD